MQDFHFLRPEWLLALIPLGVLLVWAWRSKLAKGAWQAVCDAHLIPYVLEQGAQAKRLRGIVLLGVAGALAITALAGPAWQRLPQPLFRQQSALVIMLDLSRSMDAADLKPNRLARARLKLIDLLRLRQEGQTALIVYAGDAFVVTPLTDDTDTIASMVQSLSTSIMPVQGSRPDRAVKLALDLLAQAGARSGTLLLITDGVAEHRIEDLAHTIVAAGNSMSVIGVGTPDGAPIPGAQGDFVKDGDGQIVVPKLEQADLERLARQAGGVYVPLQIRDDDLESVLAQSRLDMLKAASEKTELHTDQWREEGPWLLILLLPLATLAFRRGLLGVVLCVGMYWTDPAVAIEWSALWSNPDQRGAKAMEQQDYAAAAEHFSDPQWKAAAFYRDGEYAKALDNLKDFDTPEAAYNRGNAKARMGDIPGAIQSYEQTLEQMPDHEDAQYNLDLLKKMQQQQQSESNQQDQQQQQQQSESNQQDQQQDDSQSQSQAEAPQSAENGQGNEQNEADDQKQASDREQSAESRQQSEQQQTAQRDAEQTDQNPSEQKPQQARARDDQQQTEEQQATEQWLRRVPDDPGGLLRRKFRYQYSQRGQTGQREAQPW